LLVFGEIHASDTITAASRLAAVRAGVGVDTVSVIAELSVLPDMPVAAAGDGTIGGAGVDVAVVAVITLLFTDA
jgi:hypothetical protein